MTCRCKECIWKWKKWWSCLFPQGSWENMFWKLLSDVNLTRRNLKNVHQVNKEAGSKTSSIVRGGGKTFVNKRRMVSRTVMIRCALESPYLGQPFRYLEHHHIAHTKFFKATWSQKVRRKLMKTQKCRESQLALKDKILSFTRFLRLSFTSTFRDVMI